MREEAISLACLLIDPKALSDLLQMNPVVPDIMSTLLEALKGKEPTYQERKSLEGDSDLIIVVGS